MLWKPLKSWMLQLLDDHTAQCFGCRGRKTFLSPLGGVGWEKLPMEALLLAWEVLQA